MRSYPTLPYPCSPFQLRKISARNSRNQKKSCPHESLSTLVIGSTLELFYEFPPFWRKSRFSAFWAVLGPWHLCFFRGPLKTNISRLGPRRGRFRPQKIMTKKLRMSIPQLVSEKNPGFDPPGPCYRPNAVWLARTPGR